LDEIYRANWVSFGRSSTAFEVQLKSDIDSGNIHYLTLAQLEKVGGKEVQLYSVADVSKIDIKDDDDFPF
jgi:hypothetical protein